MMEFLFCEKCDARIGEHDAFCPVCGEPVPGRAPQQNAQAAQPEQPEYREQAQYRAPYQGENAYRPQSEPQAYEYTYENESAPSKPAKKRASGKAWGIVIVALLVGLLLCGGAYILLDGGSGARSCAACRPQEDSTAVLPQELSSGTDAVVSEADEVTTTTTAEEVTTTQKPTTTTTTENATKKEAERIRKLLVSKKWKTTLEGYEGTVTFKDDNTAQISVKIGIGFLAITEKVDAQYVVDDNCHAVIVAQYKDMNLGISGMVSSSRDDKIVIDRDKNQGKITLTAA